MRPHVKVPDGRRCSCRGGQCGQGHADASRSLWQESGSKREGCDQHEKVALDNAQGTRLHFFNDLKIQGESQKSETGQCHGQENIATRFHVHSLFSEACR